MELAERTAASAEDMAAAEITPRLMMATGPGVRCSNTRRMISRESCGGMGTWPPYDVWCQSRWRRNVVFYTNNFGLLAQLCWGQFGTWLCSWFLYGLSVCHLQVRYLTIPIRINNLKEYVCTCGFSPSFHALTPSGESCLSKFRTFSKCWLLIRYHK